MKDERGPVSSSTQMDAIRPDVHGVVDCVRAGVGVDEEGVVKWLSIGLAWIYGRFLDQFGFHVESLFSAHK